MKGAIYLLSLTLLGSFFVFRPVLCHNTSVRFELGRTWRDYKHHAWGYDELRPISKDGRNYYSKSLLWTPIDALDTLVLTGLETEAQMAQELICDRLDFDIDEDIAVFDQTITVLGGLLGGYHMTKKKCLLDLATDLGDRLMIAFTTPSPSKLPWPTVNFHTRTVNTSNHISNPAIVGTSLLEFGALSQYTKDPRYFDASLAALKTLFSLSSRKRLIGECLNVAAPHNHPDKVFCSNTSTVGGCVDSMIEYLVKARLMWSQEPGLLATMEAALLQAVEEWLPFTPASAPEQLWWQKVDQHTGQPITTGKQEKPWAVYDLFAAFFGSILKLTGSGRQDAVGRGQERLAQRSAEANDALWNKYGLMPYAYNFATGKIVEDGWGVNPEVFETNYYLWRAGKGYAPKYRARAARYFADMKARTRCGGSGGGSGSGSGGCVGYTSLHTLNPNSHTTRFSDRKDELPRWVFAETFKYLFLTLEYIEEQDDGGFDFDKIVFTTEAHILPRFGTFSWK